MASGGAVREALALLDQGFSARAWHGPNLMFSIRRVTPEEAGYLPRPGGKTIADNVVHCAYWKYAVWRRLTGAKRGSFAREGSNWFDLPRPVTAKAWKEYVALLQAEHARLRAVVAGLNEAEMKRIPEGGKASRSALIRGISMHDVYHAGQIQLIKALVRKGGEQ